MNGCLLRLNFDSLGTQEPDHMEWSGTHVTSSQWTQWDLGKAAKSSWQQYPKHPQDALGLS
jgi:hypothetical protein